MEREKIRIVHKIAFKYYKVLEAFSVADRVTTAAAISGFSRNSVNSVVKLFEKYGLVERTGRKVKITQKGEEVLEEIRSLLPLLPSGGEKMSVVVSASVKVRNCTPQMLREAAEILKQRYEVNVVDGGIVVDGIVVAARKGELVASADSYFASEAELRRTLRAVKDAVIAAEIVRAAKAMGRTVTVRVGSEGIAVDVD